MLELHPIVLAALTGFFSGFILSIPVGPINLTIMNEGARRGFFWAFMIGMGATAMEVIYCFIAFTGFAAFFTRPYIKAAMELFTFVFMLYLGVKFLLAKSVEQPPMHFGEKAHKFEARIEERFNPHSAFMTGLVRVMGNLGVLVFWVILSGNFVSRDLVPNNWNGKLACVAGVALGTGAWFVALCWAVSLGHGKFSQKTLLRMEHLSGVGMLALALIHGGIIAHHLAQHRHDNHRQEERPPRVNVR
jgi:threonine/homoserine/homoserine lactone efflux protein